MHGAATLDDLPSDTRKIKLDLLDKLAPCPPWVYQRRFRAEGERLSISEMLDVTHPDNPHVRAGNVSRRDPGRPVWFEFELSWADAEALFGCEATQYLRFSPWRYIIQNPEQRPQAWLPNYLRKILRKLKMN